MATFASEAMVRLKFQLSDAVLVPQDLVVRSIEDAHTELLRYLSSEHGGGTPDAALVLGETLLAGAHLYRSLAAKDAFEQKQTTLGGQRVEAGRRGEALLSLAALTECSAWYMLEPFLSAKPAHVALAVTDTVPILGALA